VPVLLASLFAMGLHSTLFGPVKYSILPQHLREDEIMGGTGLIEGGTFLAILGGQLLAGVIPAQTAGLALVGLAVLGFVASLAMPAAPAARPGRIDWNMAKGTLEILASAQGRGVWLAILGTSWFFAVGAVLVSEFAPLVSGTLAAKQEVATIFLIVFSLAVAAGAMAVNAAKGRGFGPLCAGFGAGSGAGAAVAVVGRHGFVAQVAGASISSSWRRPVYAILASLGVIAFSGGMFIVPLYAIIQVHSPEGECSRIAANNIVNAAHRGGGAGGDRAAGAGHRCARSDRRAGLGHAGGGAGQHLAAA
jgi:acyl-[acyl-carrier-protein]-phospholipid O-acyltransferase/long-chain-fatty-acid--[acyl-carrier-protein] ligase